MGSIGSEQIRRRGVGAPGAVLRLQFLDCVCPLLDHCRIGKRYNDEFAHRNESEKPLLANDWPFRKARLSDADSRQDQQWAERQFPDQTLTRDNSLVCSTCGSGCSLQRPFDGLAIRYPAVWSFAAGTTTPSDRGRHL